MAELPPIEEIPEIDVDLELDTDDGFSGLYW